MAVLGILVTVGFGLIFYWLRSRCRLAYGAIELVVALAVIILTFYPQSYALLYQKPPLVGSLLSQSAGILAGIYVMVRALDNIHEGLGPRRRAKWERAFKLS
jgi:hypothetical protein